MELALTRQELALGGLGLALVRLGLTLRVALVEESGDTAPIVWSHRDRCGESLFCLCLLSTTLAQTAAFSSRNIYVDLSSLSPSVMGV